MLFFRAKHTRLHEPVLIVVIHKMFTTFNGEYTSSKKKFSTLSSPIVSPPWCSDIFPTGLAAWQSPRSHGFNPWCILRFFIPCHLHCEGVLEMLFWLFRPPDYCIGSLKSFTEKVIVMWKIPQIRCSCFVPSVPDAWRLEVRTDWWSLFYHEAISSIEYSARTYSSIL